MKNLLRALLPLVVLVLAALGAKKLISMRPEAVHRPPEKHVPLLDTVVATTDSAPVVVHAQGTAEPRLTLRLTSEVTGRVLETSPAWIDGGSFRAGELLLAIDETDARAALGTAEQALAQAQSALDQEEADAELSLREWSSDHPDTAPSDLVAHVPQLRSARAALEAAQATRDRAARDLERCRVTAPFDGRVLSTAFERGELATKGAELGRIFATDRFEVPLPLDDGELAFLELPGASVTFEARFAGQVAQWSGRIVRTKARLDDATRMVVLIAEIEDPYGQGPVPLEAGTFLEASIQGRAFPGAVRVPRIALRPGDQVLVAEQEGGSWHLSQRELQVLRSQEDDVLVSAGVAVGERVVTSPIEGAVDGIEVRIEQAEEASK